jgi:hypothetical protein
VPRNDLGHRGADVNQLARACLNRKRGLAKQTNRQEATMNSLIMCSAVALNIFSAPAGSTVVGEVPPYQRVYLMDGSLLRDWVFIGKPGESGVSPRGWVIYSGLGQCQ